MNKEINSFLAIFIIGVLAIALGLFSFFASRKATNIELLVAKRAFEAETEASSNSADKQIGFIKSLYQKGDEWFLSIDYAQWLTGEEAEKAMREDGECPKIGECIVLNDYYLRNPSSLKRNFKISPEVFINMQTYNLEETGIIQDRKISFAKFSEIFRSNNESRLKDVPYWIELDKNESIIKISEQYIP